MIIGSSRFSPHSLLSHLDLHASRASTFYDIHQMVSLLAGYPLNRGSGVVMFQYAPTTNEFILVPQKFQDLLGSMPQEKNTLEKSNLWAPH